jgi:hypothetical protein
MPRPRVCFVTTLMLAVLASGRNVFSATGVQISNLKEPSEGIDLTTLTGMVVARGLGNGEMANPGASKQMPSPIPGTSVSESAVTLNKTGERISTAIIWDEPFGGDSLELQETVAAAGQTTVEYWVLTADRRRCLLNGDAAYDKEGRLLSSNFWRNDPQLHFEGSPQLPSDVFPSHIPPGAFLPALGAIKPGAAGTLNVVLGRFGYMEQTSVPAGVFRTLKVMMQVDADSVMEYWPVFVPRLAQPFFPKNVLYYDTAPPYRLVKFVGSFGYLAPGVNVQMIRTFIAPKMPQGAR